MFSRQRHTRLFSRARFASLAVAAGVCAGITSEALATWSTARVWDEEMLNAIRIDRPRPPIHARNLYHVSAAMWDAWAAYDSHADQVFHHERMTGVANVEAARAESISYAAYRLLRHRYAVSANAATTLAALDAKFIQLGYDPNNTSTVGNTPAALGNRIFQTIRDTCMTDGSNEVANYAPNNGYVPVNESLIFVLPGTTMANPNRWQPLAFDFFVEQNGIPVGALVQSFVCPHWANVQSFALTRDNPNDVYIDPGPPPMLGTATDQQFKNEHAQVALYSGTLDPNDGVTVDISPAADHNNPLGTNNGTGYPVNPITGLPYAHNIVKRADYARVLAEFWADGPNSETPPGHWNVVANQVSDTPGFQKRIGGQGPVLSDLEWDVKMYLAINGAVHDAAIGAWGLKGKYDSVRPISAIRYMGQQGQSSDPMGPSYSPLGLPLIPGSIEVITEETTAPGQRHEHLAGFEGEIAIKTWQGQPEDPLTQVGGVGWIRAVTWMPYQKSNFVTPPFAGFTSGHSTFSRSAAEVMASITGSPFFPGGLGTYHFNQGAYLTFEYGPSQTMDLQWATYYDAADEAGISRLYGGIHIASDDFQGRIMGSTIGKKAIGKALKIYNGQISCPADFNGSGTVGVDDLFGFLDAWFAQFLAAPGMPSADFDNDLDVDVSDLFGFLDAWFMAFGSGC